MSWECLGCGNLNMATDFLCPKCSITREASDFLDMQKKKRMCEECGHMHRCRVPCHVYCYNEDEDEDEDNDLEADPDEAGENKSNPDTESLGLGSGGPDFGTSSGMKPLQTPDFVKAIRYVRCNCTAGIPSSRRFEQIPHIVLVGTVKVMMYAEIMDSNRLMAKELLTKEQEERNIRLEKQRKQKEASGTLPLIMSFLQPGQCAAIPKVCRNWNTGACQYKTYVDIRDMIPWQAYRAHAGSVDSVAIYKHLIFSGGDRRILASDYSKAEVLATVIRDSGEIPFLMEFKDEIYSCSSNGSIRTLTITHNVSKMIVNRTLWQHSRSITGLMLGLPSQGVCEIHGIESHICEFYTCSEDRSIRVWNTTKFNCLNCITSNVLRRISFTCLAQSDRHLFAGTTGATIAVFTKYNYCEREDIHKCNTPGVDKSYCLQITLMLPATKMKSGNNVFVTSLLCTGYNHSFTHIWAGDSSGQMTIWDVPEVGFQFQPLKTWAAHSGSVNALKNTWRHVISVGDDGMLIVHDLVRFDKIRSIDILSWCNYRGLFEMHGVRTDIPRKIKCLTIKEDYENGGSCVVGTSYGDVVVMGIGTDI